VTYEGTNQVKESKISMLVHEYELFLMHDNESIGDMFTRFATIINSLKNLGKSYSNQELQFKKKNDHSKKKKAIVATWDDSDPSSSEESGSDEEVVNLDLMAMEEDTSEDESDNEEQFSFDELQNAY
ncbi:UBN2 domain-containing protein, partial [Cephalotus follicularis]